jgi:putative ABC transport system permease protein
VAHGLKLVIVGVALGVVGAMALTRVLSVLFYGVGPMDAPTYAIVATGLGAVALVATYLPARRAARVDPVVALRSDA